MTSSQSAYLLDVPSILAFGDPLMELVLRYRGELPPTNTQQSNAEFKHKMRIFFHPQLRYHWDHDPYLELRNVDSLLSKKNSNTFYFCNFDKVRIIPLVINQPSMKLVCELNIRLATRTMPGGIIQKGDLDNRVKTLLDSLRMPTHKHKQEWPKPDQYETPFFCLLEDDCLISKLSVITERNLEAPIGDEKESDVLLTIDAIVKFNPYSHPFGTYGGMAVPF